MQFWIPLAFTPEQKSDGGRTRYGFFHVGRLRAEASVEQLQAQLNALRAANAKRFPQFRYDELGMYTAVTPLQEALTRRIRRTSVPVMGRRRVRPADRDDQHCQFVARARQAPGVVNWPLVSPWERRDFNWRGS